MKEIILTSKKNGMFVLILSIVLYIIAIPGIIISANMDLIPLTIFFLIKMKSMF